MEDEDGGVRRENCSPTAGQLMDGDELVGPVYTAISVILIILFGFNFSIILGIYYILFIHCFLLVILRILGIGLDRCTTDDRNCQYSDTMSSNQSRAVSY